jgi:branched-chain amino acid transport system ATP-binding protein
MLELKSVRAGYGTFQALFDVSLEVRRGEAVGVIGPNGAGKTTLMRVVSGLIRPTSGSLVMEGVDLTTTPAHRIVELGVAHVPESRRLFPRMTVEDNLKMGGFVPAAGLAPVLVEQVFELVNRIRAGGLTVLIVEQNVQQVLRVVDRAYLLKTGRIHTAGGAAELLASDSIRQAYLGV